MIAAKEGVMSYFDVYGVYLMWDGTGLYFCSRVDEFVVNCTFLF